MKTVSFIISSFLFFSLTLQAQIRVACVGNSITYGAGIEHRDSLSYPAQLGRLLGSKYDVRNFGVSGSTLLKRGDKPYWKQKAFSDALAFKPKFIFIKLGTNDTKNRNWKYKEDYVQDYLALIDTFMQISPKAKIFLCLPAPAYQDMWDIKDSIINVDVIPMVKEVAKRRKLKVIDLNTALSNHSDLFPDHIHPNASGAAIIANTLAPYVHKAKACKHKK